MAPRRLMIKHLPFIHMMLLSLLLGGDIVQIQLYNGQEAQGEFIGTYMNHVHILTEQETYYYACDDILSILSPRKGFDYDCGENTVTADILFSPELDPMTGEWVQRLPDVFNPEISESVNETSTNEVKIKTSSLIGNIEIPSKEPISNFWIDNKKNTYESQQPLDEEEIDEDDFIMINGTRYVRASSDGETNQESTPIATREEVIFQATQMAQQMERRGFHQSLGVGSCLFSSIGIPASILYVELTDSRMDPGNPFYMNLDPGLKVVYEKFYEKEEKRLRRKMVYGTEVTCLLILFGYIFLLVATDS